MIVLEIPKQGKPFCWWSENELHFIRSVCTSKGLNSKNTSFTECKDRLAEDLDALQVLSEEDALALAATPTAEIWQGAQGNMARAYLGELIEKLGINDENTGAGRPRTVNGCRRNVYISYRDWDFLLLLGGGLVDTERGKAAAAIRFLISEYERNQAAASAQRANHDD